MRSVLKKVLAVTSAVAIVAGAVMVPGQRMVSAEDTAKETIEELYDGLDPESVVLTVGEDEVLLKKAFFLMKFQQAIVQDMQKGVYGSNWYNLRIYEGDRTFQENMKESIINLLVRMSLAKQHQEQLGISLSNSEKEGIAEAVDLFMKSNSEEALGAMMADEGTVTEVLEDYTLLSKMIVKLSKDVQVEYKEAKTYSYIYGSFGEDAGTEDFDDVSEDTENILEGFRNVRDAAKKGDDFDTAAAQYGYPTAIHTYFEGDSHDALAEFNAAMDKLDIGEVSDVIYVGNNAGAFIGCRQEVDEDSLADAKASLLKSEQLKEIKQVVNPWIEEVEPVVEETIWSQVTMKHPLSAYRGETE